MAVFQVSRPVDLFLDSLESFHEPVGGDHRSAHGDVSLTQGILHAQVVWVHPDFMGDAVHMGFHGEGHVGDAGSPVRTDVDLVGVNAVGTQSEVGHPVGPDAVTDPGVGTGAQVRPHVEDRVGFAGGNRAIAHDARPDVVGHGKPRAIHGEHFLAGVDQFDGSARFHRQQRRESLERQPQFGPKTAAQFHGNHPNSRHRNFKHAGQRRPDLVGALRGSVDDETAVGFHIGYARHGLQETLVDPLGAINVLYHDVGVAERLVDVSPVSVQQSTHVVPQREPVPLVFFQFRVHRGRVRTDGG